MSKLKKKEKVLILYSANDEHYMDGMDVHLAILKKQGYISEWYAVKFGRGIPLNETVWQQLYASYFIFLLISPDFLSVGLFDNHELTGVLNQKKSGRSKIIPIILEECNWREVELLADLEPLPKSEDIESSGAYGSFDAGFTEVVKGFKAIVKDIGDDEETATDLAVSLSRLPVTGEFLLGREKELEFLDRAWDEGASVVTVVSMGGVGKSALVNRWLGHMSRDNYRGAARVWGWSFYSQGSSADRQVSADVFVDTALREFGDPDPTIGSPWDRGVRLAKLVRRQKTLLVLDGLEPMQYPLGPQCGRLKEQFLQALLRELASHNPGLCIVTSRIRLSDLENKTGNGGPVRLLELDTLSSETGAELLRLQGVKGLDKELREVSASYGGHALALNLLGRYLSVVYDGDVRKAVEVSLLEEGIDGSGHAWRVMASYEKYLSGRPELEILYMLGLLSPPADKDAISALLSGEPLPGLTGSLKNLSDGQWKFSVKKLRDLGLLSDSSLVSSFATHPLVREYFRQRLNEVHPNSWTEGHTRLYQYFRNLLREGFPETWGEMELLYRTMSHGCAAGKHKIVLNIYRTRVLQGDRQYSWRKFGKYDVELETLSKFFIRPFEELVNDLSEEEGAFVLGQSGLYLRALGRVREAAGAMTKATEIITKLEDWKESAVITSNLSEVWLCLGKLDNAIFWGQKSVEFSDKSDDKYWQSASRSTLAAAHHQAGKISEAESFFQDAEVRLRELRPNYQYLYSVCGFQYFDLLMDLGRFNEGRMRAEELQRAAKEFKLSLYNHALANLSVGLYGWRTAANLQAKSAQTARQWIEQAVSKLREAGDQELFCLGLLARAGFLRWAGEIPAARHDLREALEIAERGEMKLYLTDFHLESCRLEIDEKNMGKAKEHFEKVKQLVEETGYHRRDEELKELEEKM